MTNAGELTTTQRRLHPRAEICTTAVVLARHNDGVACTIESISIGGARLIGSLTLAAGERVQLLFEIDGRPVEVFGEVVRVESQDMVIDRAAIKFIDVNSEARDVIRDLVLRTLELEAEQDEEQDDDVPIEIDE